MHVVSLLLTPAKLDADHNTFLPAAASAPLLVLVPYFKSHTVLAKAATLQFAYSSSCPMRSHPVRVNPLRRLNLAQHLLLSTGRGGGRCIDRASLNSCC